MIAGIAAASGTTPRLVNFTGVGLVASAGDIAIDYTNHLPVPGVGMALQVGSLNKSDTSSLTGVLLTVSSGDIAVDLTKRVMLDGVLATAQAGSFGGATAPALSGVSMGMSIGNMIVSPHLLPPLDSSPFGVYI